MNLRESPIASDKQPETQDQVFPPTEALSASKHIVGVKYHSKYTTHMQFLLSDGAESTFDNSNTMYDSTKGEWKEARIPDCCPIEKVEVLYFKATSCCYGLKIYDDRGTCLLTTGYAGTSSYRANPDYGIREFKLENGERIIGVKSSSRGE